MEELLLQALAPMGYPVRLQGSFLPTESYPDRFFTYWNDSSIGDSFYSNTEGAIIWQYSLNLYCAYPSLIDSILMRAKEHLKKAGWIVTGAGYSVMSDEPTHVGRGITVMYRQKI